jgi:hypothetical protein
MTQAVSKYIGSEMWSPSIDSAESSSGLYTAHLCSYLFATGAFWSNQINLPASSSRLE